MQNSSAGPTPSLVSLLICDQVIDDRMTSKKSAIGLFNTVFAASFPARVQQMTVMATLTEVSARTALELRLVRDADDASVLSTTGFVDAPSPLAMIDLVFSLQGAVLPTPGQYGIELWSGSELLGRRRFLLMGRPDGKPDGEGN